MEDPWANAWGESSKPDVDEPFPTLAATTRIGTHSPVIEFDSVQEADLGIPLWSTGTAVIWTEPETNTSLWSRPSAAANAWEPSIENVAASEHRPLSPKLRSPPDSSPVTPQTEESPSLPSPVDAITHPQSPLNVYSSPHLTPPGSPDVFGTFESATTDKTTWTAETATFADTVIPSDTSEWGAAWGSSDLHDGHRNDTAPDEWLAAKLRKEKQDSQVPPELLSSILRQFEEISRGLWPEPDVLATDRKVANDKDWRNDWRSGMESVEGLTPAVNRLVPPDLTLPPSVQFMKTATSKNMVDALRLTRHISLTRSSPMAMYMTSKGSTAWETSVKSRPEAVQDDLPVGWRLVEKEKETPVPTNPDDRGQKTGGLLSFWGRRTTSSAETKRERSSSPAPVPTPPPMVTEPARSSMESMKIHPTVNNKPKATAPVVPSPTLNLGISRVATPPTVVSNASITPDVRQEPTPPPTLASRFLNRFSRTKSSPSPRNSLLLSSDDLEFLSDSIPSAGDDIDGREDRDAQPKALSNKIQSFPLPIKNSPPPSKAGISSSSYGNSAFDADLNGLDSFFDPLVQSSAKANISSLHRLPSPTSSGRQSPAKVNKVETKMNFSLPALDTPKTAPFIFPPPPSSQPSTISPVSQPPSAMTSLLRQGSPPTRPASPFNISSHSRAPVNSTTMLAANPILPPPLTLRSTATQVDVLDDFSDFYFPPPQSPLVASPLYDTSFLSTAASEQSLLSDLHSAKSTVSTSDSTFEFDEFDEFVSSPLRSPTPPRPPTKSSMIMAKPTPPTPPRSLLDPSSTSRTPVKRVNHTRTLSLLENAAARPGQWPSPPSPLPEAIPPPRNSCDLPPSQGVSHIERPPSRPLPDSLPPPPDHSRTENLLKIAAARTARWPTPLSPLPEALPPPNPPGAPTMFEADLLGGSSMQQQQAEAVAGMGASTSSPAILSGILFNGQRPSNPVPFNLHPLPRFAPSPPPPPRTLSPVQLMKPPPPSAIHTKSVKTSTGSTVGKGGLSAQDISFFEGL